MNTFPLKTSQKHDVIVTLFQPDVSNGKLLLVNSATGVKQQTYWKFAQYFSEKGFTVITYDYYGVGLSKPKNLKKCNASMRTWGTVDYTAITQFIKEKFPNHKKFCVGHSVGALILGMNQDSLLFEKFIFVATQKAHVSNLDFKIKMLGYGGFGVLHPVITNVLGYFPAHQFGLGESLPKNASFDWRTLIINKKSTNKLYEKIGENFRLDLHQETLILHAEDDTWVTKRGMHTLLNETYPHLKPTYRELKISESEKREIGHINFFRSFNENLWKIILDELQ